MTTDPYRIWLGIPKGVKNPNYYHILGIAQGESNVDVIHSAIEQRRSYIQSKRSQGDTAAAKQILHLIDEAAATLLVSEFKLAYDRRMGIHLKGKSGRRTAYLLPEWMESRVVRVYGEGSGLIAEVLAIVAVLFGAFALMAWFSFQLPWQKISKSDEEAAATPLEEMFGEPSAAKAGSGLADTPQVSDPTETKIPSVNTDGLESADLVIGSWLEERANTPVGDRVRTFQANGTLSIKMPKSGKTYDGTWRRSGNIIYFRHTGDDGSLPAEDRWFQIVKLDDQIMVVAMENQRTYLWNRIDPTEKTTPQGDSFENLASQSSSSSLATGEQSSIQSQLQGRWKCISEVGMNDSQVRDMNKQLEVVGDRFTISRKQKGELGVYEGRFRMSDSKEFDWTGTGPGGNRVKLVGIYSWDQTTLKICYRVGEQGADIRRAIWSDQGSKGVVCVEFVREFENVQTNASSPPNYESSRTSLSQGLKKNSFEGWEIYDMRSRGDYGKKNIKVSPEGVLEFNAGMQEICLLSNQSFGSGGLKLEFQTDGNGGPMVGVSAKVKNRNGSGFLELYPFCLENKLTGQVGLLVLPRQDFRFDLAAKQSFDAKDRRKVLPLLAVQSKRGEWNTLQCTSEGKDYILMINGVIINRLNNCEPIDGKIMIWPGTSNLKIRNATFTSASSEYKLHFDSLK
jgi:uncharacterized protein (TIGR03067 family)